MIGEAAAASRPYIHLIDWDSHDNKMVPTKVDEIKGMLRAYFIVICFFFPCVLE